MRRTVYLIFGVLELLVMGALIHLGCQLPGTTEVNDSFLRAERVTTRASSQVRLFRHQVDELRRPELELLAQQLRDETRLVAANLREQSIDYDAVKVLRDSLIDVSQGLHSMSTTLDPASIGKLRSGLEAAATFLDRKVAPSALKSSEQLDALTIGLRNDSRQLAKLLRETPADLKAAQALHDSLARFEEGLTQLRTSLKAERLEAMRSGIKGLNDTLDKEASQVERLSGLTYPEVRFSGLRPSIEPKLFWPEGQAISLDMRKAASGAKVASKELEAIMGDLPKLRITLEDSRQVVKATRAALASALRQRDQVEPLLQEVPLHLGRLAEELPNITDNLASILRDTGHLKEIAAALRQTEQGIQSATDRWPELKNMLSRSASLLRSMGDQLDHTLKNRKAYESGLRKSVALAETFATMLPLLTKHLDQQLHEQELALNDLGQSIDDFGEAIPLYAQTTTSMLRTGRWLIWLVASLIGAHAVYLFLSVRWGRRFAP